MNAHAEISVATQVASPVGFTAAEYIALVQSDAFRDMRVELVGGVLEKMMPSDWKHGEANVNVAASLVQAYRGTGARVGSDVIIEIDAQTVRAADIIVVRPAFAGEGSTKGTDLLLAVEIASTTLSRDLGEKLLDYARGNVANYWIVDVNSRTVHVMGAPSGNGYAERSVVRFGEELVVPGADSSIVID